MIRFNYFISWFRYWFAESGGAGGACGQIGFAMIA